MKAKIPSFVRQNRTYKKRVARTGWRKPRGIDNKQRIQWKGQGALPKIGYGQANATLHFHPSGQAEILVHNAGELSKVKGAAVRFAGSMGRKKYLALKKKAAEMKLKVLN
ncbi:50S ribosomal protein L32e [Candidatus Micrarchaeota archaeon]|nr:50S ribosomal protein L32e [Candidatus Micrarchaeota archaeon]